MAMRDVTVPHRENSARVEYLEEVHFSRFALIFGAPASREAYVVAGPLH